MSARAGSLRGRLTRRVLIGVGGLLVLAFVATYAVVSAKLRAQFDDTLIAKSEALVTAAELDEDGFEIDLVVQDFADFGVLGDEMFEMMHADGRVFARSPSLDGRALGALPRFDWETVDVRSHRLEDGRRVRLCARAFVPKDDDGSYADARLVVATPLAPLDRTLRVLGVALAAAGGACLLMLVPIVAGSLRGGLAPLTAVNAQLRRWDGSPGSWAIDEARVPIELVPMVRALDASLARVSESFARERRFSANAAHELRTPLAEIRASAELAARWDDEATPERAAEIVQVVDRMGRLIQQLGELARAEGAPLAPEWIDQAAGIDEVVGQHRAAIAARALRFEVAVDDGPAWCDPHLWRALVENLVGNAVAHAPEGAAVHIEASPASFAIRNPAPRLRATDLDRLFERFWRPEGVGDDERHSGLGLAIVAALAERADAHVQASLDAGEVTFRVTWPPAG